MCIEQKIHELAGGNLPPTFEEHAKRILAKMALDRATALADRQQTTTSDQYVIISQRLI